jgi:hypothetical protein
MAAKKPARTGAPVKKVRTQATDKTDEKLKALLAKDSKPLGAFAEAARLTLAIFRSGDAASKTKRAAHVQQAIDLGLAEDLARYPLPLLRRLRKLLPEEISRREKESTPPTEGKAKGDEKLLLQAFALHDMLVRHGLTSEEADEFTAAALAVDIGTARKYRAEYAKQTASAARPK